jgi:hypothetical protein
MILAEAYTGQLSEGSAGADGLVNEQATAVASDT